MLIYLLRHGAVEATAESDEVRKLTLLGKQQIDSVVQQFTCHTPRLDKSLMSPYLRTRQTAAALDMLAPIASWEICYELTPDSDIYSLLAIIEQSGVSSLILVSHNPLLSNLVSLLVDGATEYKCHLDTGTLVCVRMEAIGPGCGEIVYTLRP